MNQTLFSFMSLGFLSVSVFCAYASKYEPLVFLMGIVFFCISLLLSTMWKASERAEITRKKREPWSEEEKIDPQIKKYQTRSTGTMLMAGGGVCFSCLLMLIVLYLREGDFNTIFFLFFSIFLFGASMILWGLGIKKFVNDHRVQGMLADRL